MSDFSEVWGSVQALRKAIADGYVKPGRDERATLALADEIDRLRLVLTGIWEKYVAGGGEYGVSAGTLAYTARDALEPAGDEIKTRSSAKSQATGGLCPGDDSGERT